MPNFLSSSFLFNSLIKGHSQELKVLYDLFHFLPQYVPSQIWTTPTHEHCPPHMTGGATTSIAESEVTHSPERHGPGVGGRPWQHRAC